MILLRALLVLKHAEARKYFVWKNKPSASVAEKVKKNRNAVFVFIMSMFGVLLLKRYCVTKAFKMYYTVLEKYFLMLNGN